MSDAEICSSLATFFSIWDYFYFNFMSPPDLRLFMTYLENLEWVLRGLQSDSCCSWCGCKVATHSGVPRSPGFCSFQVYSHSSEASTALALYRRIIVLRVNKKMRSKIHAGLHKWEKNVFNKNYSTVLDYFSISRVPNIVTFSKTGSIAANVCTGLSVEDHLHVI